MKHLSRLLLFLATASLLWVRAAAQTNEFTSETISIGVVVSDLDTSVDFYTRIIGMKRPAGSR